MPNRRKKFADIARKIALLESSKMMFPVERAEMGADPFYVCAAPNEYVEVNLDGRIGACCRAQDVVLGDATSVDSFASAWFGRNYKLIRNSLRRGASTPYPLSNCEGCVNFFAPREGGGRKAVNYANTTENTEFRLAVEGGDVIQIERIQREKGFCHIAVFPIGLGDLDYVLFEDSTELGPRGVLHDDIRTSGKGRHHIGETALYFSTSDGTDARRNGRQYTLRRRSAVKADAALERFQTENRTHFS